MLLLHYMVCQIKLLLIWAWGGMRRELPGKYNMPFLSLFWRVQSREWSGLFWCAR